MNKQSRRASLTEAGANVLIGYCVAIAAQVVIFPLFGIYIGAGEHALIGLLFTLVSLARSYVLRRVFETLRVRGILG
jgi:p-aminobenzoyl-glutamate transporter AbgT